LSPQSFARLEANVVYSPHGHGLVTCYMDQVLVPEKKIKSEKRAKLGSFLFFLTPVCGFLMGGKRFRGMNRLD
jgi:hypothetical protein